METRAIVIIVIRDPAGRYFVHRRGAHKSPYPGLYGLGAGGRIEPGEAAEEAAIRELLEETGIRARPRFLFDFDHSNGEVAHQVHVFLCVTEQAPGGYAIEWDWSGWMGRAEIEQLKTDGKLCPDTQVAWDQVARM